VGDICGDGDGRHGDRDGRTTPRMRRAWAELRVPISVLVLLGLLARLLAPLPALAALDRATFDAALRASLCLPSGLPAPGAPDEAPRKPLGAHCPLCRLLEAADVPPAPARVPAAFAWTVMPAQHTATVDAARPVSPRTPPPARAPPGDPTLD
jgi:hypothetical protein